MPVRHLSGILLAAAFSLSAVGCLFDSGYTVNNQGSQGVTSKNLDTVVGSGVTPDRTVDLYQPIFDTLNYKPGRAGTEDVLAPVNIKESDGKVVRYRLTRQRFGSWSPDLEFKWNWFLLQSNFLFPGGLPDTVGMAAQTKSLYDKVHAEDNFTNYFDSAAAPSIWNRINTSTKPGAVGVMVKLNKAGDTVQIQYVVPDSPAGRAGFAKNMAILAVNDSAITGDSALERFQRFSTGDSGTAVRFSVLAPGGSPREHNLVRMPVAFPTVIVDSLSGVGYISINGFTPNTVGEQSTYTEFQDALAATKRFPVTILDLRDNGGGSLDVALKMCDEVLTEGTVIIRELQRRFVDATRAPMQTEITTAATAGGTGELGADKARRRYLLLGNGGSASASEIMLVALKEGAQAPLMGEKTYGKGVGQTVRNTPGKGLALITFLKFTSASRLDYHKHGLIPDVPDSASGDDLLAHAAEKALSLATVAKAGAKVSAAERRSLRRAAGLVEWNRRQAIRPGIREIEVLP